MPLNKIFINNININKPINGINNLIYFINIALKAIIIGSKGPIINNKNLIIIFIPFIALIKKIYKIFQQIIAKDYIRIKAKAYY